MPNEITVTDATEWECPACGAHTYVVASKAPPATCWACGEGPLQPSADLHVEPGKPTQKTRREG